MTNAKIPAPITDFSPPASFDRRAKRHFRQIAAGIRARGGTINEATATSIIDFVGARQQIEVLRLELDMRRRSRSPTMQDRNHVLALARQLEATARTSRQLAAELGL